nr:sulfur carrier protein ThiS [Candidatus Syntrophocurvum alkaliphilum]
MIVNGKEMKFEKDITVNELLQKLDLNPDKVVVEVNLDIVSKDRYDEHILSDSDSVEIVAFVGGG